MKNRQSALVGQASDNDLRIALSYKEAAFILYESNSAQDNLALPFLLLVRHFLELGLKYNIKYFYEINSNEKMPDNLKNTHDLKELYNHFMEVFSKVLEINDPSDKEFLDSLHKLVKKVSSLDKNSQGSRYSRDNKGNKIIDREEKLDLKEIYDLIESSSVVLTNFEEFLDIEKNN